MLHQLTERAFPMYTCMLPYCSVHSVMRLSEQRARSATRELLSFRGWDLKSPSNGGQVLEENEYRHFPSLERLFEGKSKTGSGDGKPDFLILESSERMKPLIVIETKPSLAQSKEAIKEAIHYAGACAAFGHETL